MIVKYKEFIVTGATGYILRLNNTEDIKIEVLGKVGEHIYCLVDGDLDLSSLDKRIEAEIVDQLSEDEKAILYEQDFINSKKRQVRLNIEKEVGDIYDLVADAMKLIELNMVLTARLAGDYLETHSFDEVQKEEYKIRISNFLNAIDSGELLIRGDFESPDEVMAKLMSSTDRINRLVKDKYFEDVRKAQLI